MRENPGIVLKTGQTCTKSARAVNVSNEHTLGGTGTQTSVLERSGTDGVENACRFLPNHKVFICMSRALEAEISKYEIEKIFQAASERARCNLLTRPGFDYGGANTARVHAFTVCTPEDNSSRAPQEELGRAISFDKIKSISNVQREGMEL